MTLAGSAHLAPSGAAGISINGLAATGTCAVNEIHLPSGDHSIPDGAVVKFVTLAV